MPDLISRRRLLQAGAFGAAALALGGCASAPVTPTATPPVPSTTPPSPAVSPSASAAASTTTAPTPAGTAAPSASADTLPPLREQIAGLLVVGFRGASLDAAPWVRDALRRDGLGGVILFDRDQLTGASRNVLSPSQVRSLVESLRAAAGRREIVVAVDQEGGVVTRLGPARGFPAVASEATIGRGTTTAARTWARTIAGTLAGVGIDLNFAPVVDLDVNPTSPAIGALGRSFSADPDVVVEMASIEIAAHRALRVRTAIKHFPGIGSSTTNTDFAITDVTRTWRPTELEPFRRLVAAHEVDLVMAGHVVNGQLDPSRRPASLSRRIVTDLLRGRLGWGGVVVTDDLQAVAITRRFGPDEAVLLALEAGNDLLLFANQGIYEPGVVRRVVDAVEAAVASGRLTEARIARSWLRVQRTFRGAL